MMKYLLIILLFSFSVFGQLSDVQRQDIPFRNWIKNPGFENALSNWTVTTDSLTITAGTSKQARGKSYLTWNSAGASRVLTHETVTVDEAMKGADVLCGYQITVASGTATHLVRIYDGTSVLASATVTSSTLPTWTYVTVPSPSSGTLQCQLVSVAADEPSIDVTEAYMGRNYLISSVSQASLFGRTTIPGAASCNWVGTNSTTYNTYPTDTDCGTIVNTQYATSATKIPQITFASMPPGVYRIVATFTGDVSAVDIGCGYRFSDGTNTTSPTSGGNPPGSAGNATVGRTIEGILTYTSGQAATTINLQAATTSGSGTCNINEPALSSFEIAVYRFPNTEEQAFRSDQGPSSWSGYHKSASCTLTRTNAAYGDPLGDADCDLVERTNRNFGTVISTGGATETAGITFTPTRTGQYRVCAIVSVALSTTGNDVGLKLWDGTTTIAEGGYTSPGNGYGQIVPLCGKINVNSIASTSFSIQAKSSAGAITIPGSGQEIGAIEWTVEATDFSMSTPLLLSKYAYNGSVTSTSCAGWTVTSTSYADFAGDADCDLTAVNNSNFGTVVSSGGATETPGLVFTPPVAGLYYVCVTPGVQGSGAAGTAYSLRLWDGTTEIAQGDEDQPTTGYVQNIPLCGLYNAATTAQVTLKIQGKASTGTIVIRRDNGAQMFQWNIFKI